jgi:lipid II:glycine glycyltransferase (peptidoglycan interpeptide bridge formation enzyme)
VSRRIVSLPFSDYCDPLVSSHQDWQDLFGELETHGMPVLLRCLHSRIVPDDPRLAVTKQARWHGLRLGSDLEKVWSDLDKSWRGAIRKARREGVVVQTVDDETFLEEFAAMHLSVRKYKYRRLSQPQALFEAICRRFRAVRSWYPLVACHQGRVIAACVFLRWNDTLYYKFSASRAEELAVCPNNLLLWEGIQLAKNIGCRLLDLGLSDDDQLGLIRFKQRLGTEEREIRHLCYTPTGHRPEREMEVRRLLEQMTELFTEPTVPDEVTNRAGDMLYRYFA